MLSLPISATEIVRTYILVYAIVDGNIHALILEPQSIFRGMDAVCIIGNVIMGIVIPFLWLEIALRLNLFRTLVLVGAKIKRSGGSGQSFGSDFTMDYTGNK